MGNQLILGGTGELAGTSKVGAATVTTTTFGDTGIEATTQSGIASPTQYTLAFQITTGANGAGYSSPTCSEYLSAKDGTNPNFQCAIYTDSGSNVPANLVCNSGNTAIGTVPGWQTSATLPSCGTLAANTKYWIVYQQQGNGNEVRFQNSTGTAHYRTDLVYGTWNNWASDTNASPRTDSFYIT